jgi:hypothetical protein
MVRERHDANDSDRKDHRDGEGDIDRLGGIDRHGDRW